ncbi:EexN family lipoprotein [Salmonella enterica]
MSKLQSAIIASSMLFAASMLTGCKEEVYSVEYYSSNIDKAEKIIDDCKKGIVTDQNCDNARTAFENIQKEKYKEYLRQKRREGR